MVVTIVPDNYPNEVSWALTNVQTNAVVASGNSAGSTGQICIPDDACFKFTIYDSYGDGICCSYGNGSYTVTVDGNTVATGGDYDDFESTHFNCPPGYSCNSAIPTTLGAHSYRRERVLVHFYARQHRTYEITTCSLSNCDTKIWVYDHCLGLVYDNSNIGTVFYDDNNGGCGLQARVTAYMAANTTYYIRIGTVNGSCPGTHQLGRKLPRPCSGLHGPCGV